MTTKTAESFVDLDGTRKKTLVSIDHGNGKEETKWMPVKQGTKIRRGEEVTVDRHGYVVKKPTRWV